MELITELDFIWEISQTLSCNNLSPDIVKSIDSVFKKFFNSSKINIIYYNAQRQSFCNFCDILKPLSENDEKRYNDIFQNLNSTMRLNFMLNDKFFIFDDDFNIEYKIKPEFGKNIFIIPLIKNYKCFGFLEIIQKSSSGKFITKDLIKALFIIAAQIASMVTNRELTDKISRIADFYKAQKNIAKILETQYDYSFLIPVIGEILDNFAKHYFTYIFMKNDKKEFELAWPLRYDKKRINPILEHASTKITINTERTTILFPICFENSLQGTIIIDGKDKQIAQDDIDFLAQLSRQTSTTLDKAGVYAEIEKYATQDALTGLNNRRSLDLRISQEVAVAKRKNLPLCAMMLDVDFFKKTNDTYGHYVGDIILKSFGKIIKDEVREYDFPARYGGEEFFIILPSTTVEEALNVANRLRERIENEEFDISKYNTDVKSLHITTSIGLTALTENMDVKKLYVNVDKALYEAKKTGRNKVVLL